MKSILLLLTLSILFSSCAHTPATPPVTTASPTSPTPMDDGTVMIAADTALLSGVAADPFAKENYQNPDAPHTRFLRMELTTYELIYRDSARGEGIDCDLDRYVATAPAELSVWYRAGTDKIVALELATARDFARDGEAALVVKAENILGAICDLPLDEMERTYTYRPKIEATQERLATVHYERPREDGRTYCCATVDYHVNLISIEISNEPEPPAEVITELEQAADQLDEYLIHTRAEKTPVVTALSNDPLPDIYFKDGRWVLETKRNVTYLLGKNEMTRAVSFYLWLAE